MKQNQIITPNIVSILNITYHLEVKTLINSQISVLAIAPYRAMTRQLETISKEFPEIKLTIYVGDREEGIELAKENFHSNFDAILSRGGTATLLHEAVSLPVIEIETSSFDLLAVLNLADVPNNHVALIGYPNIIRTCNKLCELFNYDVDVYEITSEDEIYKEFPSIIEKNYSAIIGDVAGYTCAHKYGIRSYLITSGDSSIRKAFQSVRTLHQMNKQLTTDNHFYKAVLQNNLANTVVLSEQGRLVYKSNIDANQNDLINVLREKLISFDLTTPQKFHFQIQNSAYTVFTRIIHAEDEDCIAFDYSINPVVKNTRTGIDYYNADEVKNMYENSIYGIIGALPSFVELIKEYNHFPNPILLEGENGMGKAYFSMLFYLLSNRIASPYIHISGDLLTEKSWEFLLKHHQSPLCDTNTTICFTDLDSLSHEKLTTLLSYILSGQCARNNRLIFSFADSYSKLPEATVTQYKNKLHCNVIPLTPLRDNPASIKNMATLYINWLNITGEKSIQGFTDEALSVLAHYTWPQNYFQLQRVLNFCYSSTDGITIDKADVQKALSTEEPLLPIPQSGTDIYHNVIDLSDSLENITNAIVRQVLRMNNGNKSQTAESLGISRATLWRILKR